jgi:multidrug efflux pump subunit AcrA (membrane-fusion protein)
MKKILATLTAALLLLGAIPVMAEAAPDAAVFSGEVAYRNIITLTAPFGGTLADYDLRVGDTVKAGETLFTLDTEKVYAPIDGTVRGLMAQAGDDAATVAQRYDALLRIEPAGRYTVSANTSRAYNSSDLNNTNRYLNEGETVYLRSSDDDDRTGTGVITAVDGRNFTVEVKQSNLNVEETVSVYRDAAFTTAQRLASYARVSKAPAVQVTGTGSVMRIAVAEGQTVKRGDLLFTTVTGTLGGLSPVSDTVAAPVDVVIKTLPKAAGTMVQQDDVLATLCVAGDLWITFDVDESDLAAVQAGGRVRVTLDALPDAAPMEGTIDSVSALRTVDGGDAQYTACVALDSFENLRDGMNVSVYLQ